MYINTPIVTKHQRQQRFTLDYLSAPLLACANHPTPGSPFSSLQATHSRATSHMRPSAGDYYCLHIASCLPSSPRPLLCHLWWGLPQVALHPGYHACSMNTLAWRVQQAVGGGGVPADNHAPLLSVPGGIYLVLVDPHPPPPFPHTYQCPVSSDPGGVIGCWQAAV